uniref:hypothetical protein n=1 Tax=Bacillus sp. DX2.2 TaxID=3073452 RepID=UPI00402A881F
MNIFYIDLNIITIKISGPIDLFEIAKNYFPGAIKDYVNNFDFEINYQGILEKKPIIPQEAKLRESFGGASYFTWQDSCLKTYAYCPEDYIYGGHLIEREGKQLNLSVTPFNDFQKSGSVWAIRLARELFLMIGLLNNYVPIHASAISLNKNGVIFFGKKGSGKTTSMFTFVNKLDSKPISNDLVLVGKDTNGFWEILGWGWRVTIGNDLLEESGFTKDGEKLQNNKIAFYPLAFSEYNGTSWCWQSKLKFIVKPNVKLNKSLLIEKITPEILSSELLLEGIEEWKFGDYLNIGIEKPNFEKFFNSISNEIPGYRISGDIWASGIENRNEWDQFIKGEM